MVWWSKNPDVRLVDGAGTFKHDCENCNNQSDHVLHKVKSGVGFGNPITGRVWASTGTEWILICPICEAGLAISKEDAQGLRESGRQPTSAPQSAQCPSCAIPLSRSAKFCGSCGHRLG